MALRSIISLKTDTIIPLSRLLTPGFQVGTISSQLNQWGLLTVYSEPELYLCFPTSIQDSSQCHKPHEVRGRYTIAAFYVESEVHAIVCAPRFYALKVSKVH